MTMEEFMEKTGVSKKKYVEAWVTSRLIPGVTKDDSTGALIFPKSARRPYRSRLSSRADDTKIRASMLNACLKRQHICPATYPFLSEGEFYAYIDGLADANLIRKRVEDGITYYDSTPKSDEHRGKSPRAIRAFIIDCIGEITERLVRGAVKAVLDPPNVA